MSFICQPTDLCVVYDVQSWQSQQHEGVCFTTQDGLTGSAWGDWANYTASPLRAFENELGVQAPVGLLAFQHYIISFWIDLRDGVQPTAEGGQHTVSFLVISE